MSKVTIDTDKPGFYRASALAGAAEFYADQGFLVVVDGLSDEEVAALRSEAVTICRGERGDVSLPDDVELPDPSLDDDAFISNFLCIHHPHKISEVMNDFLAPKAMVDTLTRIIGPNVKCMQSMLFIKSAGKPGQAWHQDEDYIPTRDRSLCGGWIAMDDATVENGCLWIIPGSHKPGLLWPQYPHDDPRFDCAHMSYDFPYTDDDAVPVEVPAGAIVFFNGYLLHRSLPNTASTGFRRCLVNHYMSAESLLPWHHKEGVGMGKQDMRDIVMVAGEDPYAWKGIQRRGGAHVRPAGDGGCGDGRADLETFVREKTAEERAGI